MDPIKIFKELCKHYGIIDLYIYTKHPGTKVVNRYDLCYFDGIYKNKKRINITLCSFLHYIKPEYIIQIDEKFDVFVSTVYKLEEFKIRDYKQLWIQFGKRLRKKSSI